MGGRLVERITAFAELAPLVRAIHEHFDGRGYPDGLAGARSRSRRGSLHVRRVRRDDERATYSAAEPDEASLNCAAAPGAVCVAHLCAALAGAGDGARPVDGVVGLV